MVWFASFIYGVCSFFLQRYFPVITITLSLLLLLSLRHRDRRKQAVIVCLSLFGFFYARYFSPPPSAPSLLAGKTLAIAAEPVSLARAGKTGGFFSQTMKISEPEDGPEMIRLVSPFPLPPGRRYSMIVSVSRDAALANPGSAGQTPAAYLREIVAEKGTSDPFPLGYLKRQRERLNPFLQEQLSPETAPFIMAIVTGERGSIPQEMRNAFSSTGLAHILSISGAHFGLLLFVVFRSARALIRRLPYALLVRITTWATPDQCAAVIALPFMVFYLGISSLSVPALRAFIMVSLFLAGLLVQRQGFWLNTLLFAAAVILLISPESVLDLSFQLSFVSVLAIGLVSEKWLRKETDQGEEGEGAPERNNQLISYLRASLIISCAATIVTAPLVAYCFHYLPLVSPLANMLFTPLIGFVILPLALFSSFFYLFFGLFPFPALLDMLTRLILSAIEWLSRWEWSALDIPALPPGIVIAFYAGSALYLFMRFNNGEEKRRIPAFALSAALSLLPLLLWLSLRFFPEKGLAVTYLDAGQADAAVVELPDGRTLVVDTGRTGVQVASFLRYRGIREVEAIALSHGQADHAGGLQWLLREFRVREVWDNGRLIYPSWFPEGVRRRQLQRGDLIEGRGYRITALHPYDGFYTMESSGESENNDSLVLKIEGRKQAFLFAGDIEEEAEENLAALGRYLRSDILKTPHHGSRTAASEAFISAVSPRIAVISVGKSNPYGHPHQEALSLLASAQLLRTDQNGAVKITELPDGRLETKQWREFGLRDATTPSDEWLNIKKLFWVW